MFRAMRNLLDDLLISEVIEVSGAKLPSLKQWIDTGLISAPPRSGKHRRFSAHNTIEVILMAHLVRLGVRPSAAGRMVVKSAPFVLHHYTDDWGKVQGNQVVMTLSWVLLIDLDSGLCTVGRADAFTHSPANWLKIDLEPVMGGALTRALAVAKARDA
jgi:hypothetical protein